MPVKLEQYLLLLAVNWFFTGIDSSVVYPRLKVIESTQLTENYKLDSDTEKFRVLNVSENSDLIVDRDSGFTDKSKLVLECRAPYPIQWIYKGDGNPEFATNTSMKTTEFVATVSMGFRLKLGEHDTGNYTCKSIRNPDISIYLYLFVPGNSLFTTKGGESIIYNESDENARLPCSLSQPKATVTLQKSINGTLHCPMNDSISFDPKTGYTLRIGELTDAEGIYVCTAGLNHHFQIIEYTLVSSGAGEKLKPEMNTTDSEETGIESEFHSPCSSNPCGENAICRLVKAMAACRCKPGYKGNPFTGCTKEENGINSSVNDEGTECNMNIDCASDKACVENKCMDPCPLICAKNSTCKVTNHIPQCACLIGEQYHGDCISETSSTTTTTTTTTIQTTTVPEETTTTAKPSGPCEPNPCGDYTSCKFDGKRILCVCEKGYLGTPPNCRPECTNDHDCPYTRACTAENRCENPCRAGVCGKGALCKTINHYPICSCPSGKGDPYIECRSPESSERPSGIVTSPCNPSPCAEKAECRVINNQAACRCMDGYRGNALKDCTIDGCNYHKHCPENLACFAENGTCVDPCLFKNPCNGKRCTVKNHIPTCKLNPESSNEGSLSETNPCFSSPCGPNTVCRSIKGASSCSCRKNYVGNPYIGCSKQRCTTNEACKVGEKCIDEICQKESQSSEEVTPPEKITGNETGVDVCNPSPCKRGAECRIINKMAVCKCVQPLKGDPYNTGCEDPCSTDADCSTQLSCSSKSDTCTNPCDADNACGVRANCTIINHKVTCACPENYWGNPVIECFPSSSLDQDEEEDLPPKPAEISDPCQEYSCGSNEKCVISNSMPTCECVNDYKRQPGIGCVAVNTTAQDFDEISSISTPHYVPCHPLPCGRYSYCNEKTDPKSCSCLENFYGDPYSRGGCRKGIECETNKNCSGETACLNRRCLDPCSSIGVCGVNQNCQTKNHAPVCRCKDGYAKTTSGYCQKITEESLIDSSPPPESIVSSESFNNSNPNDVEENNPNTNATSLCDPSPCGDYSECSLNADNSTAICSCQYNMINTPPNCRPECLSNEACSLYETCQDYKCIDPCIGACGDNANCYVIRRIPSCSCRFGFTGDPIKGCLKSKGNWFLESKYVFPFSKKRVVDSDVAL